MNEKEKRMYLLEKEDVKRTLLKLGIPTMIGMLASDLCGTIVTLGIWKKEKAETLIKINCSNTDFEV